MVKPLLLRIIRYASLLQWMTKKYLQTQDGRHSYIKICEFGIMANKALTYQALFFSQTTTPKTRQSLPGKPVTKKISPILCNGNSANIGRDRYFHQILRPKSHPGMYFFTNKVGRYRD